MNFLGYAHWFMSIIISQMRDNFISVDQAKYITSIVAKYLDIATVKANAKFYMTNLPYDMILNKADSSTSDEQVENLTKEFNIHYRACIGSFIYFLSTRVDLSFAVQKLETFSENSGELHFEGLVHLLRYTRDNKNLGLKYYANINDAPVSDLLRQASIKNENHLMDCFGSSWQECPEHRRSTGVYSILYQGGPIEHDTHVPVDKASVEIEYNAARTLGMALAHFRMLIHELLNKDPEIVPEEDPLIVLDSKCAMCMANNGKDTKHTSHISRIMNFVRNGKKVQDAQY